MSRRTASAGTVRARSTRRPVVALLGAYGISLVGTRLSMIALPLFVLETTGSATRTGLVAMAEMGPYVVVQALAGPITDRVGARRISVISDVGSVVLVGAIPVLHALGMLHLATLLVLVALAGALRGPGDAAKYVMVPPVASSSGLPVERVLGLEDGISRAASVVGPLAAAALVALLGPATAIGLDAASFAVAAVVVGLALRSSDVRTVRADDAPSAPDEPDGYWQRLRSGARFVRQDGLLRSIVGMIAVTNLLDAAYSGVLVAVWATHRGGGAGLMGSSAAFMAGGAVIGALVATAVGHRLPRRAAFAIGFFGIGAPRFAVLGLDAPLWLVFTVLFVGGIGCGMINPILGAVELERTPEHLRARVMSLITSAAWCLIPFGGLVGGVLSTHLGIGTALLVCGGAYLVATTLPVLRPEWREMDRRPAAGRAPQPEAEPVVEQPAGRPETPVRENVTFEVPAR